MIHLINSLQFELSSTNEQQAFSFRENFGVAFQQQIVDITDELCSKYVGDEEWLRIDKLEIDLGSFSPAAFDRDFSFIFKSKFEKELIERLSGISSIQRKASAGVSRMQMLTWFLQHGNLPWWVGELHTDINEIIIELIANQPKTIVAFLGQHQANDNLWIRIAFQLNQEAKTKLISIIDDLKKAKALFSEWAAHINIILRKEYTTEYYVSEPSIENIILKNAPVIFKNTRDITAYLDMFKTFIGSITADSSVIINEILFLNNSIFKQVFDSLINNESNETIFAEPAISSMMNNADEEVVSAKYAVRHAGIILLYPFIKSFFTNLQLLDEKEWKNKESQYKAVHLLKFLSTGEQKMPEYNLQLEKIMCGFPIEEPIPVDILLNENEINEVQQLLESVIEHWKALKNTSVNGLRESFLQRDGILTAKENNWLLQVERKTIDILVESIPWGYSTITFSWNGNLIFVEW